MWLILVKLTKIVNSKIIQLLKMLHSTNKLIKRSKQIYRIKKSWSSNHKHYWFLIIKI